MTSLENDSIIAELKRLVASTPDNLWDLMNDSGVGRMNREIEGDVAPCDELTSNCIALFSGKAILGLFDQEDLTNAYRDIGVQRSEKWAAKMMNYIQLRR